MSLASETLRAEAVRFRRLRYLTTDPGALKALDDHVRDLEARAEWIEEQEKRKD